MHLWSVQIEQFASGDDPHHPHPATAGNHAADGTLTGEDQAGALLALAKHPDEFVHAARGASDGAETAITEDGGCVRTVDDVGHDDVSRMGGTVKLRTKVTRGAGSPAAALAMVHKLIESAQARWRSVNAPHLVALVRAGARFERGVLVESSWKNAA